MADNRDAILLESVKTHRSRLRAAFLFGQLDERRTANDNIKRLIGSLVFAAVACAGSVGVSFVMKTLADQEAARGVQQQQAPFATYPPSGIPTPAPSDTSMPGGLAAASTGPTSTGRP